MAKIIRTMQKIWRPLMALVLLLILTLYVVIGFFLSIYKVEVATLPDGFWALVSVFFGSYTLSRGAEKFSTSWRGRSPPDDEEDQECS